MAEEDLITKRIYEHYVCRRKPDGHMPFIATKDWHNPKASRHSISWQAGETERNDGAVIQTEASKFGSDQWLFEKNATFDSQRAQRRWQGKIQQKKVETSNNGFLHDKWKLDRFYRHPWERSSKYSAETLDYYDTEMLGDYNTTNTFTRYAMIVQDNASSGQKEKPEQKYAVELIERRYAQEAETWCNVRRCMHGP